VHVGADPCHRGEPGPQHFDIGNQAAAPPQGAGSMLQLSHRSIVNLAARPPACDVSTKPVPPGHHRALRGTVRLSSSIEPHELGITSQLPIPSACGVRWGANRRHNFWDYQGVAQRGSVPVALILLVLVLLGATAVITMPGGVFDVPGSGASAGQRVASATVVTSVPCGSSTPGDVVDVQVNGVRTPARLDGCGHTTGEQIQVAVPANPSTQDLVVHIYTPGMSTGGGAAGRLNWVLLTVAAIAGGGYMLLLRPRLTAPGGSAAASGDDGLSVHRG
jgi:hypothetical protein